MQITMIAGSPHGLSGFGGTMAAVIAERLEQQGAELTTVALADLTIKSCSAAPLD